MSNQASEFETQIRADLYNLSLLTEPETVRRYLETMLVKLTSEMGKYNSKLSAFYRKQIKAAHRRNMELTNIDIDGSFGFRIEDVASGVKVKVKYRDSDKGYERFKDLQNSYINSKLDDMLSEILEWFNKEKIFDSSKSSIPEIFSSFVMYNKPEKKDETKGDKVIS